MIGLSFLGMKGNSMNGKGLKIGSLALALSACASDTSRTAIQSPTIPVTTPAEQAAAIPIAVPATVPGDEIAAVRDPKNPLYQRSVFFDYDSPAVPAKDASLIQAHGRFLASKPIVKIAIQGNTDERGSREYNLSLG